MNTKVLYPTFSWLGEDFRLVTSPYAPLIRDLRMSGAWWTTNLDTKAGRELQWTKLTRC